MAAPDLVTEPHCRPEADTLELPRAALCDDEDEPDPMLFALARDVLALSEQVQEVAAILGACSRCFGLKTACVHCSGKGSPGWQESSEPALVELWLRNLGRPRHRHRPA